MFVGTIHVWNSELKADIFMGSDANGIRIGRALRLLICGIQHELNSVELKQYPIKVRSRFLVGSNDPESQFVAIETDRGRHIEHRQQRRDSTYVKHCVLLLLY